MSKNLKIFLGISYLILLFVFLYFIFTAIEITKLNDFSYYKDLQGDLSNHMSENISTNIIYFFIFAVIWVALLGFGSPLLIISGILFGKWVGTLISVISISVGALILYVIGNFFFRDFKKTYYVLLSLFTYCNNFISSFAWRFKLIVVYISIKYAK